MKTLTVSFLCLMMYVNATAQLELEGLVFGPKAGLNIANLSSPDGDNIKSRLLYHLGIFGAAKFNENMGGQIELVFSHQGGKEDNSFTDNTVVINLSYLNLPVLFTYSPSSELSLFVGPQIGLLVGANGNVKGGQFEGKYDLKDRQSSLDVAFVVGAKYKLIEQLHADLRINLGLINAEKDGGQFFNRVIQIGASYDLVNP